MNVSALETRKLLEMKKIKLPTAIFEYDPTKPLGRRGGFGQVFTGRTISGDMVAVKKLHVSAADAAHRELRIAEELKGRPFEHVIPFIDSGEDADSGEYFVIMPKAERSLQNVVDNGKALSPAEAASILLQITKGLLEVGDLVHRDLKPDNILFHEGKWKVADFGIARFVEETTASNTLKDCLSPYYAAPEQWRFERATHATDIYALGCIGFFLLTAKPPFITDPQAEHIKAPVPDLSCTDPRLLTLIRMMLRKLPETRPNLSRISQLLTDIVSRPQVEKAGNPISQLAEISAVVAEREQRLQAQKESERKIYESRNELLKNAFEILEDNIERLWGKVHNAAPNAERSKRENHSGVDFRLGDAVLAVNFNAYDEAFGPNAFQRSGWDVIAHARIIVKQSGTQYSWGASLWYTKIKGSSEYRWYEVSYWTKRSQLLMPCAASTPQDADLAASASLHAVNIIFGPVVIDDEKENEFHERWIWIMTKAANGKLGPLSSAPIRKWPPAMN